MAKKKSRELTPAENAAITKLVLSDCVNYDKRYKTCFLLGSSCYMLNKSWTGCYCKYFENTLLPAAPAVKALLLNNPAR